MNHNECPPHVQLMQYLVGKWISKPIYVAAELGIADILSGGPEPVEELARLTGTHAPTLFRVMRALASVGVFAQTPEGHFQLTPMAECLKTGAMRSTALMFHSDWNDNAWSRLSDTVRTGETAFQLAHRMPIAQWLEQNPDAADVLSEANSIKAAASHRVIVDAYDFAHIHTLTDIGGGYGALMAEILAANPSMTGIVADLPQVIKGAEHFIREKGLENRCKTAEIDFFHSVPPGSDAYLLSHVLHDWTDEQCVKILRNCREAMKPGAKLLVVEMLVPPGNAPSIAKLLDLEMLVITGGRERTEAEFKSLFELAGFTGLRVIPTKESINVLESIL